MAATKIFSDLSADIRWQLEQIAGLREPALATGGIAFDVKDRDLDTKVAARFASLRQSYILMYTPERVVAQKDGWHEIKVSLRPGLKGQIQARPGYYAPIGIK